jgi:hypothetical protein
MSVNYKTKGIISNLAFDEHNNFSFNLNPIKDYSAKIKNNICTVFYKDSGNIKKCLDSYLVDTSVKIKVPAKISGLKNLVKIAFEQNKVVEIEVEIINKNNTPKNCEDHCVDEEQKSHVNNCCTIELKTIKVLSDS